MVRPIAPGRKAGRRFFPTRARGQCFLRDGAVIERIVATIAPAPAELLVELGAGSGELTLPLARAGARLVALESDRRLAERLRDRLGEEPGLEIELREGDAMELDLGSLVAGRDPGAPLRVCGNLPYSVASPILLKLLEQPERWSSLTLMFQDEVATRLVAAPATKAYGFLSVMTQQLAVPRVLFRIPPSAFRPRPRVVSALVRLDARPDAPDVGDPSVFRRLVKGLIAHRRKTIANNIRALSAAELPPTRDAIHAGLEHLAIDASRRAETLTVEQFAALSAFCASHA